MTIKNKDWLVMHLREAMEELERTITDIESDPDYGYGDFSVSMQHLYSHLNTAWNSRDAEPERIAEQSDEDFRAWRRFPIDIDMGS